MEKALLHICCGPCAITPTQMLRQEGFEVEGFFYNPNIHPFSEYRKRYQAVVTLSERLDLSVLYHQYDFDKLLREFTGAASREDQHCVCWRLRLQETARTAKDKGIAYFTTTLLVSPYQDTEKITAIGQEIAASSGLTFLARDFKKGFSKGHQIAREWQLYHQNYCGCLYSEKESIEEREKRRKA
jgi:predicted adenine nucleotide alpha hydrolase (AANH) superfamily ATPase